jgi:hypothetical protein
VAPRRLEGNQGETSLELFARNLEENFSRYEEEALTLLREGRFQKLFGGVTVVHFLRDGGSGYQISNEPLDEQEEVFFQSLDDDPDFRLKLLVDQLAQSEVDASFLINL